MLANKEVLHFPVDVYTYWKNVTEKRIFMLVDSPGIYYADELKSKYVRLQDWRNVSQIVIVNAAVFLQLIDSRKLIPFLPQYH